MKILIYFIFRDHVIRYLLLPIPPQQNQVLVVLPNGLIRDAIRITWIGYIQINPLSFRILYPKASILGLGSS